MTIEFSDVLGKFVQRSLYSRGQLSELSGVPKSTIGNWLSGRISKPHQWQPILKIAAAMHLSATETDQLLNSAAHQPLAQLQRTAATADLPLFTPWETPTPTNTTAAPFQALADLPTFVGRVAEQEALRQALLQPHRILLTSLFGMGGVGKTTLATHLAYELRDHFPDGVLWARLDTSDTMSLLTMLAGAYGVDVTRYQTIDSRSAIVRSLLADKRALLILDNAENSNQVAPLLPPTTGSCTVLLTTRHDLAITDGWRQFELRPFTPDSGDALTLFGRFLSSTLVQEQKDCLLEIADLVGHLPLALALIAGQLARHPTAAAIQRFHAALQETNARLSMIQRENRSVRATFELSYQQLSAAQQSFFRQLAIFNGDDFDSQAAAAVTKTSLTEAQTQLQQLQKFSLLQESNNGRYRLHPLLRDYALELLIAQQEEHPTAERMIAHYLTLIPTAEAPDAAVVTSEMSNLMATLKTAQRLKLGHLLSETIQAFFNILHEQGLWQALESYTRQAIELSQAAGDIAAQAAMTNYLSRIQWWRGENIYDTLQEALALAQQADDPTILLNALQELGAWHNRHNQPQAAEPYHRQALTIALRLEQPEKIIALQNNLGKALEYQGRFEEAVSFYTQAYQLTREVNYYRAEVIIAANLGCAYDSIGQFEQREHYFTAGRQAGLDNHCYTAVMGLLGDWGYCKLLRQQLEEAKTHLQESLDIARDVGHVISECVRLADLGEVARQQHAYETAESYFQEALALGDVHNLVSWLPIVHLRYANLKADLGDHAQAEQYYSLAMQNRHLVHMEYDTEIDRLSARFSRP